MRGSVGEEVHRRCCQKRDCCVRGSEASRNLGTQGSAGSTVVLVGVLVLAVLGVLVVQSVWSTSEQG